MKVRKTLLVVVLTGLLCGALWGQEGQVDSLEKILPHLAKQDSNRCSVLNELAFQFLRRNPDSSILYAKEAIRISESIHHLNGMTEAANTMAKALMFKNELDSALLCIDSALSDAR
jgi:hypothetical protein